MARLVLELPRRAVKTRIKVLILVLALAIGLPLLTWTATFFYWHFRIRSGIREWEKAAAVKAPGSLNFRNGRLPARTAALLIDAGCRAYPYLLKALDESTDPEFQEGVMTVFIQLLNPPEPISEEDKDIFHERLLRWQFIAEGLRLEREEKLSEFRAWWRENGTSHHQGWRVWSSDCRGAR